MKQLLFYIFFSTSLFAQTLHITKEYSEDSFEMKYLKDTNSSFTIEDVQNQIFTKTIKNNFNLGYHKGSIWFQFDVKNSSEFTKFILTLNEHFYEKANLYYESDGKMIQLSNSLFTPLNQREVKSNKLGFEITLPKEEIKTLYLQLQGKYAYFGKVEFFEKDSFYFQQSHGLNLAFTFALGIVCVLIFFTFFLYSKTKEKIYIYYIWYSFFLIVYFTNITGLLVYLNLQNHIYTLQFSAAFMVGFLILFSKEYLQIQKYFQNLDTILTILALGFFLLGILVVYSYQPWNMIINNSSGLVCILLIIISIIVSFRGHTQSKYYTLAMMIYLAFVFLFTFMINGALEYTPMTRYGFVPGVMIEMLLFSYLLSNKYHLSKQSVQTYLENEVMNRTSELKLLVSERELLLKEVHHRVKNNFHMITGLLWMEEQKDSSAKERFKHLRTRIKSMSIIHEKLYKSKNLSHINIKEYLDEIIANIITDPKETKITINSDIENIILKFEDALSIGFIATEIINNTFKHNKVKENLSLDIHLVKQNNRVTLSLKDNGIGFDYKDVHDGMGLSLIESFAKNLLQSDYDFVIDNGVEFILRFDYKEEDIQSES